MTAFLSRYGLISALLIGFFSGLAFAATGTNLGTIGFYLAKINNQSAAYTLVATNVAASTDCGTVIVLTNAATQAVTLPNTGVIGCGVTIIQGGAGKVTVTAQAGGSLVSPHGYTGTFATGSIIGVLVTANGGGSAAKWLLSGDAS